MEKKNLFVRVVAGGAALCLTAALAGPSPAGAETAPPGVGTSTAEQVLLSLQLGDDGKLLDLDLMADKALSRIDEAVGPSVGLSRLAPLSLSSGVLPGLAELIPKLPTFESRTPGGQAEVSGSALDLSNPGGIAGLPLGLLGGSLVPASLTSSLTGEGAASTLAATLADLEVLNGLLTLDSVTNKLGSAAAVSASSGNRNLNIGAISLLDLGDLLEGLNLDLAKLPLSIISDLLDLTNLPVALPTGADDLTSAVDGLLGTLTSATSAVTAAPAILDDVVADVPEVNGLLGGLPAALPVTGTGVVPTDLLNLDTGTVQALLTTLQSTLTNLLGNALSALDGLALLELDGATVAANTRANSSLATSLADVTASLGGLSVLGLKLPGVDLASVGNLLNGVTGQLAGVLGSIDPSLANLVKVAVLDKSTSLTTANGYNNALAGIDVLSVSINPPDLLSGLVSTLTGNTGLSSIGKLSAAGVANPLAALPVLGDGALGLGSLLNLPAAVGALTEGLTLKVGSVRSASQFRLASAPGPAAVAAPVPVDTLPRTGGDNRTLGILAAGMAMLALGVRRWARGPEVS